MTRIIQYFKVLFLSWYSKGKTRLNIFWLKFRKIFHSPEYIKETPETSYIYSQKYQSLFNTIDTQKGIIVSEQVWDKIQQSLPSNYILPNPFMTTLFKSMSSDSYDKLFNKPSSLPHFFVDNNVWNQITNVIPPSYILPNPVFQKIMKPMSDEYYETIFSKEIKSNSQVFVDNTIWEPIKNSLPKAYSLPNKNSNILFNTMNANESSHPIMPKANSTKILTDEEIKQKIFNGLPENYTIANLLFSKHSSN